MISLVKEASAESIIEVYKKGTLSTYTTKMGQLPSNILAPTITLDTDVAASFPDSESVNKALRTLILLVPNKKVGEKKAKYKVSKKTTKKVAVMK